jgi:hypothetical protein
MSSSAMQLSDPSVRPMPRAGRNAPGEQVCREQAMSIYPFLQCLYVKDEAGMLHKSATGADESYHPLSRRVRQAATTLTRVIDAAEPLTPVLPKALGVLPWMVEHFRRYWPALTDQDDILDFCDNFDAAEVLQDWTPETAPRSGIELYRSHELLHCRHAGLAPLREELEPTLSSADRQALRSLISGKMYDQFLQYVRFIGEARKWAGQRLQQKPSDRLSDLVGTNSVAHWLELCWRWQKINHRFRERVVAEICAEASEREVSWTPVVKGQVIIGSYEFSALSTSRHLVAEGQRMSNCAPTYVLPCLLGQAHLLHVSNNGQPVATLEIDVGAAQGECALVNAEGPTRSAICGAAKLSINQFVAALNDGSVEVTPVVRNPRGSAKSLKALCELRCADYTMWSDGGFYGEYFDWIALFECDQEKLLRGSMRYKAFSGRLYDLAAQARRAMKRSVGRCGSVNVHRV